MAWQQNMGRRLPRNICAPADKAEHHRTTQQSQSLRKRGWLRKRRLSWPLRLWYSPGKHTSQKPRLGSGCALPGPHATGSVAASDFDDTTTQYAFGTALAATLTYIETSDITDFSAVDARRRGLRAVTVTVTYECPDTMSDLVTSDVAAAVSSGALTSELQTSAASMSYISFSVDMPPCWRACLR